nr:hypothetical protein [Micromonospora haikouensis]
MLRNLYQGTTVATRPATHRADLDGRRRGASARASQDCRPRVADHDTAVPAPRPTIDY